MIGAWRWVNDHVRQAFAAIAEMAAEPLAILAMLAAWVPWAFTAPDQSTAMDRWLTGGAMTLAQMIVAGQRIERLGDKAQLAAIIKAVPGAPNDLADVRGMDETALNRALGTTKSTQEADI